MNSAKSTLRKQVRTNLATLTPDTIATQSTQITNLILNHPSYISATTISIYISKTGHAPEISTAAIIADILAAESTKKCYIPRCVSRQKMEMVRLFSIEDLQALPVNRMGIPEPRLDEVRERLFDCDDDCVDLVIMPLLAFDASGNRLGHGGGYYDRFLAECRERNKKLGSGRTTKSIALALSEQCLDYEIPHNEFDLKPDEIVFVS